MGNKYATLAYAMAFSAAICAPALADSHEVKIQGYVDSNIRGWLMSDEIINAVDQQNIDNFGLTNAEIDNLDQRWRQEKFRGDGSLISSKMNNDLSSVCLRFEPFHIYHFKQWFS